MDLHHPPKPSSLHHKLSFVFPSLFFRAEVAYALSSVLVVLSASLLLLSALTPLQPLSFLGHAALPCDYSDGEWVWDVEAYPEGSYAEDCPFLDPGFRCLRNGRNDTGYRNWRWQPRGCHLPRFNASEMLERSRNKRIVFAGDSIGRNQWESLLCMLSAGVSNKSSIFEAHGNPISKHKGFLSIRFDEYNLSVEYYRTPFLVVIGRPPPNSSHLVHKSIRLDTPQWRAKMWAGADVLVMNTGHWWNRGKTIDQGYYFQVGEDINMTMGVNEAFQKTMETLKQWAISNMQLGHSYLFFRSYSPSHYRNGTWDTGGVCDSGTRPQTNNTLLEPDPWYNQIMSSAIKSMEGRGRKVQLLNITYLTEFRMDGHPSSHREPGTPTDAPQDCSHWCLPGVPDTWNELLYAHLLAKGYNSRSI
ncbi:protein trichome birefringence-like 9 [Iris pallida]|uniref:Protein trichome birefringence-like 9 n=1 Tax=Iris pallida TaxID=29817 RepID=A0AAX6DFI8_IRIPA|nr:protein trichome birefringence-like 9 [Iris pallida]